MWHVDSISLAKVVMPYLNLVVAHIFIV